MPEPFLKDLTPFEYYNNVLGNPKMILAPMVEQSELAFRLLCRKYGAQLCYTPMIHAAIFLKDKTCRKEAFKTCPTDRPLIAQFCSNDEEIFVTAAQMVQNDCDGVDLNLGCPQNIAKRGRYGAFLQDDWDLIHRMIRGAHLNLTVPVSCKIRIFPDVKKTVSYAQMIEASGCQMMTVHGRDRDQKGSETGLADWNQIRIVKQSVKIPVVSNGNIQFHDDVFKCLDETGVDGVMAAEATLHNPSLFSGDHYPVWKICQEYMDLFKLHHFNPNSPSFIYIRSHLFKILHHVLLHNESERDKVNDTQPSFRTRLGQAYSMLEFQQLIQDIRQKYQPLNCDRDAPISSSTLPLPIYMCQPYIRPLKSNGYMI